MPPPCNTKSKRCSSKSSRAIQEMSREFSKAKHSHSATPKLRRGARNRRSVQGGECSKVYARYRGGRAHPIRGIRIHVNVGQHCLAPILDEKSPSMLYLRRQNHEHVHRNQSVHGFRAHVVKSATKRTVAEPPVMFSPISLAVPPEKTSRTRILGPRKVGERSVRVGARAGFKKLGMGSRSGSTHWHRSSRPPRERSLG